MKLRLLDISKLATFFLENLLLYLQPLEQLLLVVGASYFPIQHTNLLVVISDLTIYGCSIFIELSELLVSERIVPELRSLVVHNMCHPGEIIWV